MSSIACTVVVTVVSVIGIVGTAMLLSIYVIYGLIERAKLAKLDPTPTHTPSVDVNGDGSLPPETVPDKEAVGSR